MYYEEKIIDGVRGAHWERGYRVHGLWYASGRRVGKVALGPLGIWDGVYRWSIDGTGERGEQNTLTAAKRAVEGRVRHNA